MPAVLLWFRSELRLHDNAALKAALDLNLPIIPVFIQNSDTDDPWKPGDASQWWLHHALNDLGEQLTSRGSQLILRTGDEQTVLESLIKETGATHLIWSRSWEPFRKKKDAALASHFEGQGISVSLHEDRYLFAPHEIENQTGGPYQVFTPFWKCCLKHTFSKPIPAPKGNFSSLKHWPQSTPLASLNLLPKIRWDAGLEKTWTPTRKAAETLLRSFNKDKCTVYKTGRDIPSEEGTSRLSPYLHFGQLGIREVAASIQGQDAGSTCYLSELGWREFAGHLLHHFPKTPEEPLRDAFKTFPWKRNARLLKAWQQGKTGYPIVDAGMRELWQTGWMHNRVRMIAGSVLVKHFLQPWQAGARWFWDTLVDADLASNTLGWQWIGGCGADAAPYFRVFNPVLQGKKFDPDGMYVKRYIPELAGVDKNHIHEPWSLGLHAPKDYPAPIIPVEQGRENALAAYKSWKG